MYILALYRLCRKTKKGTYSDSAEKGDRGRLAKLMVQILGKERFAEPALAMKAAIGLQWVPFRAPRVPILLGVWERNF